MLKDADRIFTNIYGWGDAGLRVPRRVVIGIKPQNCLRLVMMKLSSASRLRDFVAGVVPVFQLA